MIRSDAAPLTAWDSRTAWRRLAPVCILLAAVQAWACRYEMDADAISYMDMAIAAAGGRLGELINGYWSPLYPALVAAAFVILGPTPAYEAAVAHLVNLLVFGFTLACFHGFWARARSAGGPGDADGSEGIPAGSCGLPSWAWWTLGYGLFAWTSLEFIGLSRCAPDLLVMGFTYWAAALVLRIRAGDARARVFAGLGVVLGTGYLAKTVLFVLAFVFIVAAAAAAGRGRPRLRPALLALAVFGLTAGPYVLALSAKQGRWTYGDVGRIGYALYVSGYHPAYEAHDESGDNPLFGWQGEVPGLGRPVHPKRRLHVHPTIEEFAGPIGGSYPFWYDPSWWYEGLKAPFNLRGQLHVLACSVSTLAGLCLGPQAVMIAAFLLPIMVAGHCGRTARSLAAQWPILLPALAGIGLFSLLLVLPRYIAAFVVMTWAGVLRAVPAGRVSGRLVEGCTLVSAAALVFMIGRTTAPAMAQTAADLRWRADTARHPAWQMACGLADLGIGPGDTVGHIGKAQKSRSYWASVARVRIVAELRPAEAFWKASPEEQARLIEVFRRHTQVKALVGFRRSGEPPPGAGWQAVPRTPFFVYRLDR